MTLVWLCGFSQPHYAEIPPPLFEQMRQYLQMLNPKIKSIEKNIRAFPYASCLFATFTRIKVERGKKTAKINMYGVLLSLNVKIRALCDFNMCENEYK